MISHISRRGTRFAVAFAAGATAVVVGTAPALAAPGPWHPVAPDLTDAVLYKVSADGADGPWTAGITVKPGGFGPLALHWNGTAWVRTAQPMTDGRLDGIAAAPGGQAWAVGSDASDHQIVQHWDGSAWRLVDGAVPDGTTGNLVTVDVTPRGTVWVGGGLADLATGEWSQFIRTRATDGTWRTVTLPADADVGNIVRIVAFSDRDVYALGFDGFAHFDGVSWRREALPAAYAGKSVHLYDLARHGKRLWVVGHVQDDTLWRRPVVFRSAPGGPWTTVATPEETGELNGIVFDRDGDPVIVGETADQRQDVNRNYVLTTDSRGRLVHAAPLAGGGNLYGADTDSRGRIWTVGVAGNPDNTDISVPYAAYRD